MHATFIGMYVLSWFLWTWEAGTLPTRSDHQSWLGSESELTTWNRNKLHTQCGHYSRTTRKVWTRSRQPGCRLSQSLWGPMTNITMSSGAPFLLQQKNSACQSLMTFYSGTATMRRRQDFFCSAVLRHCLATTVKFSWYTGSCSPFNDLNYCNMRNWANYQPLRKQCPPTKEDGTNTLNIELPRTRGARQALSKQSLPGPDSGDRRSNMTSRLNLEPTRSTKAAGSKSPVDVRVGEMDGQPSPGAHQARPLQLDMIANHFGQINQFETPQGNLLHVSYRSRIVTYNNEEDIITVRQNSPRKVHGYHFPPGALTGTLVLLLVLVNIPPVGPCKSSQWKVLRLFKGVYRRRRLMDLRPSTPHTPPPPAARKMMVGRPSASKMLLLLALLGMLQVAGAVPSSQLAHKNICTQHAQGFSTLDSKKTSFQKAQRRALNTGSAIYKGRHMTAKQLGVVWTSPTSARSVKARPQQTQTPRIRFVTWNAGGLNLSRQSELRTWLEEE